MKPKYCIINGVQLDIDKAGIGVNDLALQRGYGIFDFFKIIDNKPVFVQFHLDRFYRSASGMHLTVKYSREELISQVLQLVAANDLPVSGVKLTLTGGYSSDGFTLGEPNLIITQSALPSYRDINGNGISIITWEHQRQMPEVKTIDYLMAVYLQPVLKERNAQDVLYHNNGLLSECPRSNIFIVNRNGQVLTPANNVLAGITRGRILELQTDIDIRPADITLEDLDNAAEVFITSSTKNILPVTRINNRVIGDGQPGFITQRLAGLLVEQIHLSTKGS
ncbi:MAG: amino acid aminotransferase [Chitinophagaceae bacterium]|nr:MAG: amino acid aminotransferase [Chitinophagaceae bacterium]